MQAMQAMQTLDFKIEPLILGQSTKSRNKVTNFNTASITLGPQALWQAVTYWNCFLPTCCQRRLAGNRFKNSFLVTSPEQCIAFSYFVPQATPFCLKAFGRRDSFLHTRCKKMVRLQVESLVDFLVLFFANSKPSKRHGNVFLIPIYIHHFTTISSRI